MERVFIKEPGERVRFNYEPVWSGIIEGWTVNFIHANAWRVGPDYAPEDLLQEGWIIFDKLCRYYPEVANRRHFVALYKTSYNNFFINIAKRQTARRGVVELAHGLGDEEGWAILNHPVEGGIAATEERLWFEDAPAPVRRVITQLVTGEVDIRYEWHDGQRETLSEFLARLAGGPEHKETIVGRVLNFISGKCGNV